VSGITGFGRELRIKHHGRVGQMARTTAASAQSALSGRQRDSAHTCGSELVSLVHCRGVKRGWCLAP
jgi:hypothetical protein